jgi:quinol-cytochrome oxidoreductase complex cytochrome b subunit
MALYVVLPIFLYQKGSSESKNPDATIEEVDKEPDKQRVNAPWPVKRGGWILMVYKHSLSITLFLFFALSFLLHWNGSMKGYNQEQALKNLPTVTPGQYLSNSRFWFESFQNWQSEFLSVFVMVILTVYLRQTGSPMSKPIDAPLPGTFVIKVKIIKIK